MSMLIHLIFGSFLWYAVFGVAVSLAADNNPATNSALDLTDKTLVAWAYPGNLTQRGGSLLTLIDEWERFDAVVFGERSLGKWMAGSDFFHRTPADQSAYPPETADDKTLVQIAIAYKKNVIIIYRNSRQYARYQNVKPQSFDQDVTVLLGLRYIGHEGKIGFFAGAIEEARIYGSALDAETIASLKPNILSEPKPLAHWTFEDGTADDSMQLFPTGKLHGHACIADGKLHLDGKDSYVEIRRPRPPVIQNMFYKARLPQTGNMWDTWLYLHNGTYYLYYLANHGPKWNNISMATSPDGVHWKEIGRVLSKEKGYDWMGTGSTWKSPDFDKDGKFFMNFSQQWPGRPQTIFFAESKDLVHWQRLDKEKYEFKQDPSWYKPQGRWDCIYTIGRPDGGLYGYWTATPKTHTGGRFGFGQTLDGARWKALPPPQVYGVGSGEVGAVEKIGNKYYMMFGTRLAGVHCMATLVSDKPEGPFYAAKKNLGLLTGHTYFSRFFPTPDGVLVNHHSIARNGQVYFGLLKSTVIDEEGTLRLGWWKGNEKIKEDAKVVELSKLPVKAESSVAMFAETLNVADGVVLEGRMTLPTLQNAKPLGLYVSYSAKLGTAILVHPGGRSVLGVIKADGTGFKAEKKVDRQMNFGATAAFRLLLKESLLEFYLNDILIECYSLPANADGKIGLIGDVTDLNAWQVNPAQIVDD